MITMLYLPTHKNIVTTKDRSKLVLAPSKEMYSIFQNQCSFKKTAPKICSQVVCFKQFFVELFKKNKQSNMCGNPSKRCFIHELE